MKRPQVSEFHIRPSLANAMTHQPVAASGPRLHVVPILSLALVLRLAVIALTVKAHTAQWFFGQASELGELAHSLVSGQGLSSPFGGSTGPSAFLAPGYPELVAAVFRMFGSYSTGAAVAMMLLQAAFAVGTVGVILLLGRRLFNNATANLAGTVWAVSPPLLFLPTIFWETSLSIFLLTSLIALALHCAERPTSRAWIALALCALLALSVNPSFATVIAATFVWTLYKTRQTSSRVIPAFVIAIFLLVCSLWPIRNLRLMHAFIPLRSNMGYELWQGNRPGSDGFFSAPLHPNVNAEEFHRYQSLGEVDYMREKSKLAKAAIFADLGRFLALSAKRFLCFWTGVSKQSVWLMVLYTMLTTVLGGAGIVMFWREQRSLAVLLLIPLILLPLPYYLTHPDYRFRCVIDPLLTLLVAHAVITWFGARQSNE